MILMKTFDRLSHSGSFLNALVENVHRHRALAKDPTEPMDRRTESKIEDGVDKKNYGLIDLLPSETQSTLKAFNDSSIARGGPPRYNTKKGRETSPRPDCRNSKKLQSSFSSLTFLDIEIEYTTSIDNSESNSYDLDYGCRHRTIRNGDNFQVFHRVNSCFRRSVDYKTYLLDNKSSN